MYEFCGIEGCNKPAKYLRVFSGKGIDVPLCEEHRDVDVELKVKEVSDEDTTAG